MTTLADRYELIEKVGEGGLGVVWRAHDARLDRDVAIKLLRPVVSVEEGRRRFVLEARVLAALASDHIVRIYDYVETAADTFLVLPFESGDHEPSSLDARPAASAVAAAAGEVAPTQATLVLMGASDAPTLRIAATRVGRKRPHWWLVAACLAAAITAFVGVIFVAERFFDRGVPTPSVAGLAPAAPKGLAHHDGGQ